MQHLKNSIHSKISFEKKKKTKKKWIRFSQAGGSLKLRPHDLHIRRFLVFPLRFVQQTLEKRKFHSQTVWSFFLNLFIFLNYLKVSQSTSFACQFNWRLPLKVFKFLVISVNCGLTYNCESCCALSTKYCFNLTAQLKVKSIFRLPNKKSPAKT